MNKAVVGAVALVVVAGGGVGFAAWSGPKVANELQAQTAAMLAPFPGVKVVENSVTKGLFSSVHTVTIDVGCAPSDAAALEPAADGAPAPKPMQITWRDHVSHGPLPGGRGLGLATIDSEFVLPPEVATQLARLYGDQAPLKIHTVLGFGGGYVSDLTSPPFKYTEAGKGDIDWQGVRATVRGNLKGGVAAGGSYAFEAPGLNVNFAAEGQATGTLRVGRMALQGDVQPTPGASLLLAPGRGTGSVESIALALTPAGGKAMDVHFDNIALDSEAKVDDQGLWSAISKLSLKGRVDDFPIDKVEMQVSMNRLHGATYQQIVSKAMQSSFSCYKPGDEAAVRDAVARAEEMQKGFNALLVHNPEYALDRLAVQLGGKTAELSYRLGAKGMTAADAELPLNALLTTKAYGGATFKVVNGWLEQVVKKVVSAKVGDDAELVKETTAQTMAMINGTLDDLVTKGYVAREGEAVVSKATFEGGLLKVNDQPLNFPVGMLGK